MKPRLQDELRKLRQNIDELTACIKDALSENEQAALEREKLLQEQWRLQREAATQRRNAEDFETIQTENRRLQEAHEDVKATLHEILAWSKTAATALKR
jgi:hypothetical protein